MQLAQFSSTFIAVNAENQPGKPGSSSKGYRAVGLQADGKKITGLHPAHG